jgi:hypothetical protein
MTLREKQCLFCKLIAELITAANLAGYEVKFGEALRPPETAELYAKQGRGSKYSLHTIGLAIDLLLFQNGRYLTKTEDYEPLGKMWESKSTSDYKCAWGGRFFDGNHFSIAHGNKK